MMDVGRIGGELHVEPREDFVRASRQSRVKMSAGVFAQRGRHLQRTFAAAGGRHVVAEGHHLAVFVADFAPAFADLCDAAALEILGEQDPRVAFDARVTGIL